MESTINGKFFRITEYSTYLSPYFADGTAGMINILLEYREKFHDTKYDASILDLVNSISQEHMPKNSSLYRGLGSFIYVLQKFKKIFKSSKRDNDIREMFRNLPLYSIVPNGNRYMVDESFRRMSLDFADGNAGIIFLIEQAKQMGIL
nr:lanthionine synthetase LanC family protein [Lactobacillus delbrueckii]